MPSALLRFAFQGTFENQGVTRDEAKASSLMHLMDTLIFLVSVAILFRPVKCDSF